MYAATRLIRGGCKTCQALGKPSLIVSLPPETPAHAPPRSAATGLQEGGKLTVHGHHNSSLVHIIAEDSCRTGWHMQPASFIGVSEYQLFTSSLLYTIFLSSSHPTNCMLLVDTAYSTAITLPDYALFTSCSVSTSLVNCPNRPTIPHKPRKVKRNAPNAQ